MSWDGNSLIRCAYALVHHLVVFMLRGGCDETAILQSRLRIFLFFIGRL